MLIWVMLDKKECFTRKILIKVCQSIADNLPDRHAYDDYSGSGQGGAQIMDKGEEESFESLLQSFKRTISTANP